MLDYDNDNYSDRRPETGDGLGTPALMHCCRHSGESRVAYCGIVADPGFHLMQAQQTPVARGPASAGVELESVSVAGLRQRFRDEVQRMTAGGMRRKLDAMAEADALAFPLAYVYLLRWLELNVPAAFRTKVVAPFRKGARVFLMDLLTGSADAAALLRAYISHMSTDAMASLAQHGQLQALLAARGGDAERLIGDMLEVWNALGLLSRSHKQAYSELGHEERARYAEMLGPEDRERLELVDALPDPGGADRLEKAGIIPAMGCPQTCRHCMFIWRPPTKDVPDPGPLYDFVNARTTSLLFTGGDLTRHLEHFQRAIAGMDRVSTFAILLNGDFADDPATTERIIGDMAKAIRARPKSWAQAQVLLQISFDELHQEVVLNKKGQLAERIPVAKIANIVACAPRHREVQLCLLHKQNALNFSMDVLKRGVFARLAQELGRRGHQVRILSSAPSPRTKRNPRDPSKTGAVLKDASFTLARWPNRPILLTSSTVDAYGRAETLDEGETVKDRDLLAAVLQGKGPPGEGFDTDLMFWHNGWATLFSAVHICLGDFHEDGGERILERRRKDPLTAALGRFDLRLLDLYSEVRPDLQAIIDRATSPHHLFHTITEEAAVRLHMTRRLIGR